MTIFTKCKNCGYFPLPFPKAVRLCQLPASFFKETSSAECKYCEAKIELVELNDSDAEQALTTLEKSRPQVAKLYSKMQSIMTKFRDQAERDQNFRKKLELEICSEILAARKEPTSANESESRPDNMVDFAFDSDIENIVNLESLMQFSKETSDRIWYAITTFGQHWPCLDLGQIDLPCDQSIDFGADFITHELGDHVFMRLRLRLVLADNTTTYRRYTFNLNSTEHFAFLSSLVRFEGKLKLSGANPDVVVHQAQLRIDGVKRWLEAFQAKNDARRDTSA